MKATFEANRLGNNNVLAELWYTSSSDRSLDLIRDMAEYIEPINEIVTFEPKFVTWACPNCDEEFKKQNCLADGKYCGSHHSEKVRLSGREVLMEDIRQYCIYALGKAEVLNLTKYSKGFFGKPMKDQRILFFEYVKIAHDLCRTRITKECSMKALKALGI